MGASIVVVEDDDDVADMMVRSLTRAGHVPERVSTGADAVATAAQQDPDLMLLDLGLPDLDGIEVCKQVRAAGYRGGVVIVTARTAPDDVIDSLDAGANDFLAKPFGLAELGARVNEVLRRRDDVRSVVDVTTISGLTLNPARRQAHAGPVRLPLTDAEFDALALLAAEPGEVVPTRTLVTVLWGADGHTRERALAATIKQLQRKLDAAGATDRVAVRDGGVALDTRAS